MRMGRKKSAAPCRQRWHLGTRWGPPEMRAAAQLPAACWPRVLLRRLGVVGEAQHRLLRAGAWSAGAWVGQSFWECGVLLAHHDAHVWLLMYAGDALECTWCDAAGVGVRCLVLVVTRES